MSFINGLGANNNYYQNQVKNQKAKADKANTKDYRKKADKTSKSNKKQVELSDKAKALLEELKAKYADMDFFVASYDSEEEAQKYLSQGTKAFSVLIDPEDLEAMANDEEVKNNTLSLLDEARNNLTNIQDQLKESGNTSVKNLGVTINSNGQVSYFANLEEMSQKQRERIEKKRAENKAEEEAEQARRDEAKEAGERYSRIKPEGKHTTVYADSIEELLEKIQNVNWDEIGNERPIPEGKRFDFSI